MHTGTFTFKGSSTRTGELLTNESSTPSEMEEGTAGGDARNKRVIAEAIEKTLIEYEKGAIRTIACGVLWNLPWVVLLVYVGARTVVYKP